MPVIAVVNRKGGSGKSTLAAHLAAWCAHQGHAVMLGDVDRQQSTRSWLRKRSAELPAISAWNVDQNILRVPKGVSHVILDTPGGLHGFDLARMVMFADIILMPVCGSAFDRESAADCHAELKTLPRIASGRCKVAAIGMRLDVRTRTPQVMKSWAEGLGIPFLGVLRETQTYVQCLERGMTLFDLPAERVPTDLGQWNPILNWLSYQMGQMPVLTDNAVRPAAHVGTQPAPAVAAPIPNRLLAARAPAPAPRTTVSAQPPRPDVATAGSFSPASRPVASVTRIGAPRVLDRVAASAVQRPAAESGRLTGSADTDVPNIPSFLKLVKC